MAALDDEIVKLNGFITLNRIGQGAFSEVYLIKDKENRKYAMKKILKRKSKVDDKNQVVIMNKLQSSTPISKFIIQLVTDFENNTNLYLVFELAERGTLFQLRRSTDLKYFQEETAKFYSMQVILAIEYIHRFNIVHRDIKPENILMSAIGILKLSDFGLAKDMRGRSRTYTHCGTLAYVAPEMIEGTGYNTAVDWWAMGVLIYEMMCGRDPFTRSTDDKTRRRIMNCQYKFPNSPYFSEESKVLIDLFLQKNPELRLGYDGNQSDEIRNNAWFHSGVHYDWNIMADQPETYMEIDAKIDDSSWCNIV